MANPARDFRNLAQSNWPGAVVVERGRKHIKHKHPTEPNKFMYDGSIGPVHIRGTETEIDTALVSSSVGQFTHEMTLADYNIYIRADQFNAGDIFEYRDPDTDEWVRFDPQSINWVDENTSRQQIAIKQNVSGVVTDDVVEFHEAYGTGKHFQYQAQTSRLKKIITIDNLSDLPTPTVQGNEVWFEVEFSLSTSSGVDIYLDGVKWQKANNQRVQTSNRIEFRDVATGQNVFWYLDFPRAWDSEGNETIGQMEVRRQGGPSSLFITVRIPYTWIEQAVFPIHVDPTVDTGVGAGGNDGKWYEGTTGFDNSSLALDFGNRGSSQYVTNTFALFTLTGPSSGDTIDVSYITLRARASTSNVVNTNISCGAVDDASAPTDYNGVENASKTASVAYDNASGTSNNSYYDTSSLNTPTQAVVDRAGWSSGQDIIYYIEDDGSADSNYYQFDAYEQSTSDCPKLHVEYTAGGGGGDVLNRGLSNIDAGVIASAGGGHAGLHPIDVGYVS